MMKSKVYLIGAGPGDEKLLTQKAVEIIKKADVIVHDRLISKNILKLAKNNARFINVGKEPNRHLVPQNKINEIIAKEAEKGNTVARIKGGDPFVFGRGGEEALYLRKRGVDFEVVPGITSSIAVPCYAGIPVTHRGVSSSFHVITGHKSDDSNLDWEVLSKISGTLIFLMGVKSAKDISKNLIKYGKDPKTPTAIIMKGTTLYQKTATCHLKDLVETLKKEGIKNPAVIVIGDVVKLRKKIDWFEEKVPKKILVTGSEYPVEFGKLEELGAKIIHIPNLKICPVSKNIDLLLQNLQDIDILIFSSKNSVKAFKKYIVDNRFDLRKLYGKKIWAIGKKTAKTLETMVIYPDLVPREYCSEGLLKEIRPSKRQEKVVILTSDIGGAKLLKGLKSLGYDPTKVVAYKNLPDEDVKDKLLQELEQGIDIAVFTSPSAFAFTLALAKQNLKHIEKIAAIGPVTQEFIEKEGFEVDIVPQKYTLSDLAREIEKEL